MSGDANLGLRTGESGLLAIPMVNAPAARAAAWRQHMGRGPGRSEQQRNVITARQQSLDVGSTLGIVVFGPLHRAVDRAGPPASSAGDRSDGQENVGYSSALSSKPRRPEVPAP